MLCFNGVWMVLGKYMWVIGFDNFDKVVYVD